MSSLLIFFIVLGTHPIPRHPPGYTAHSSGQPKAQTEASDEPANPFPAVFPEVGSNKPASERSTEQKSKDYVTILSPEPLKIDSIKDWRDRTAWIFGLLLTIFTGIQVWYLRKTLIVVAEQSRTMATQAGISRQALVAQFRPKIVIRQMRLDPNKVLYFDRRTDKKWTLEMQLHNPGGTTAHILKCEGYFQIHGGDGGWSKENVGVLYINTPFDVPAGGKHPVNLELPGDQLRGILTMYESFLKDDPKDQYVRDFLAYHGTITYRDDNGLDRETGFARNFHIKSTKFLASNDPEAEYQD